MFLGETKCDSNNSVYYRCIDSTGGQGSGNKKKNSLGECLGCKAGDKRREILVRVLGSLGPCTSDNYA